MTSDSRIVISSEALKSLSFAFKWSMSGTPKREACYLNNLRASPLLQKSTRSVAQPKPSPHGEGGPRSGARVLS